MTDSWESVVQTVEASESALARREWELRERVAELESELDERIERERIRELELASQRRELEVRFAYNATLEQRIVERIEEVNWMHEQFERQAQGFAAEREHRMRELEGERATVERIQQYANGLQHQLDAARAELAAERQRISYRVVQRIASRLRKHRVVFGTLRRSARVLSG